MVPTFISIVNKRYYKQYDDSDNACCWQVDALTGDIDEIFAELGIAFKLIGEDWGSAYTWSAHGVDFCMQVECDDVETCRFKLTFAGSRKWLLVLSRAVTDPEKVCPELFRRIHSLNEG